MDNAAHLENFGWIPNYNFFNKLLCKDAFFSNFPGMEFGMGAVPKGYGDKDCTKTARRVRA